MKSDVTPIEETILKAIEELLPEKGGVLGTDRIYPKVDQLLSRSNKQFLHKAAKLLDTEPRVIVEDWVYRHIDYLNKKYGIAFITDDKRNAAPLHFIKVMESNLNWAW